MGIFFSPPHITKEDKEAVWKVLGSGWLTTGPAVQAFEEELGVFCGGVEVLCLSSCTAALELALRLLGIGPGDEVIVPAYTYTATAEAVIHTGARCVLADCGKGSFQMDYDRLERLFTSRTKAVIPVDYGGIMADYVRVREIAQRKSRLFCPKGEQQEALGRVAVIGDGAHSLGATSQGWRAGQAADFTCFSFHAVKNLTTGEGGALAWPKSPYSMQQKKRLKALSLHGQTKSALEKNRAGGWEYDVEEIGYKCNMTDICAALGLSQLKRYDNILARRHELGKLYEKELEDCGLLLPKHSGKDFCSSAHLYPVRIPGFREEERNRLIRRMGERGIALNVHYKPLPLLTAYKKLGFEILSFPNAMAQYQNEVTLPLYPQLTEEEIHLICDSLRCCLT